MPPRRKSSRTSSISVSSPRVDLYAPIHKALRSFMSDTLDRVGRMDLDDGVDTQRTLAQLEALLTLCHSHVQTENRFVHPAIEARQPKGARRIAEEHVEHLESIDALRAEVQVAARVRRPRAKPGLALRLYRHLALFVAENFQHMHIEETAHNAALWAHYSDAELLQLHDRLLASIDPREMLEVARWMVPALNPAERAAHADWHEARRAAGGLPGPARRTSGRTSTKPPGTSCRAPSAWRRSRARLRQL